MRSIGFSTGALAKGDFRRGIDLQRGDARIRAIELSALRDHELPGLVEGVKALELDHFAYVSVHAPSKLSSLSEAAVFDQIAALPAAWSVIVHPELLGDRERWRSLGPRLCIENMDNRKTTGRTVDEVAELFEEFPEAGFCLDLGHARQIDPTMATALRMLRSFGPRLRQLHVSEVGPRGEHRPLSVLSVYAFLLVRDRVAPECPVIIESVVGEAEMGAEILKNEALFRGGDEAYEASFGGALEVLKAAHAAPGN
jgi:hypothetical protein